MLIDRPQVVEGSVIVNATVPSGTSDPSSPNIGELFYRTDLGQLRSYGGSSWAVVSMAGDLTTHASDATLHLTSAQNTLLDGLDPSLTSATVNYLVGVTSPIQTQLNSMSGTSSTHTTDITLHLTANQNTFLDALSLSSGSAATTLATSVNSLTSHLSDATLHLTADQNTFLDGLNLPVLTASDINNVPTVASNLTSLTSSFNTHVADTALHLTSAQNTWIDAITASSADVNRVGGLDAYLTSNGSTLTGTLTSLSSSKVAKSGDTMTGNLSFSGGAKITGLPAPVDGSDAVNKDYVDIFVNGLHWTTPVKAATTVNVTLSGLQVIDGVSLTTNDRVLVKDQTVPAENGVYLVSSSAWSRASDYNAANEINQSAVFVLSGGATNGKASFIQTATIANIGDTISFSAFSGPVVNTAGNGISLSPGGQVALKESAGLAFDGGGNLMVDVYVGGGLMLTTDNSTSSSAGSAQLAMTNVGTAGTYRSVTTDAKGRVTAGSNPTTIAGYGITDAQPLDSDLTAIAGLSTTGIIVRSGTGTALTRSIAVSGTGISLTNADGIAGNPTITSNATSANTVSTIVARDASGNFAAGAITMSSASVSGQAIADVLSTVKTGAVGATRLYINSPSGQTAAIARFMVNDVDVASISAAGVVTGTSFVGPLTGNASTASAVAFTGITGLPSRTTWNTTTGAYNMTVGQLAWKNFGNNHSIFDASAGTSPDGGVVNNTNSALAWTTTYPTLMGWNGTTTYGVRVDSSRLSDLTSQRTFSNVKTDGVLRGSYGSISVGGSAGSYAGIDFTDAASTFMVRAIDQYSGLYKDNTTWLWAFDGSGALVHGTIPAARVSGDVASASSATLATKASTLAQGGGNGAAMTFYWNNQAGQPTGVWGSNDGVSHYIYNPSNFSVASAATASNCTSISNATGSAYTWTAGNNFRSNADTGAVGVTTNTTGVRAYSDNNSGAIMSFLRAGQYAINMGLDSDNVFRIGGWSAAGNRLQMDMSGNLTMAGDVTAYSDVRKKKDIAVIENAIEKVKAIRGVTFTRIEDGVRGAGVIAQEVQNVLPEVVKEDAEGTLSVAYGNMVGLLIEAIKDLSAEVKTLKAELAAIKG